MFKKLLLLTITSALLAAIALAGDLSGKWTGMVPGREGATTDTTFVFKVDGGKLTGTVNGVAIIEGIVTGDAISFAVEGERGKQLFKGTLAGDELKMTRQGRGEARPFTAKRAQ